MLRLIVILLFGCAIAQAETLTGEVISIADGDTLTLLVDRAGEKTQVKIRLNAIDAPEKGQPFGNQAKLALGEICFRKPATALITTSSDKYGRTVADVTCGYGNAAVNANEEMVTQGMAWVYRKYAPEVMYGRLYRGEQVAKESKRGLWSDPNPMNPQDWRHRKK